RFRAGPPLCPDRRRGPRRGSGVVSARTANSEDEKELMRLDLAGTLEAVRSRMASAAARAGREPSAITLIAVTKVFPAAAIREAYELGVRDFGENYLQEFEGKLPQVQDLTGARFHLIGHLQSNK